MTILTRRISPVITLALFLVSILATTGCTTAPTYENRAAFEQESTAALGWFKSNVPGLGRQIDNSAGYAIFPSVGQFGIVFLGGKFGRGALNRPDGTRIGWAAVNTGSLGLQVGAQGYKMLVIFQDEATLDRFKDNRLSGSVSATAVGGDAGVAGLAPFERGVAVYQGAQTGLMAGVNIGLDVLRYKPMDN